MDMDGAQTQGADAAHGEELQLLTCSNAVLAAMSTYAIDSSILETLVRELSDAQPATVEIASEIAAGIVGTIFFDFDKLWDASKDIAGAFMSCKPPQPLRRAVDIVICPPSEQNLGPAQARQASDTSKAGPVHVDDQADAGGKPSAPASQPKSRQKGSKGVSLTAELWSGRASSGSGALFTADDAAALSVLGLLPGQSHGQDTHAASAATGPVCRFFVAGTCKKRDCPFSHDLSSTPCAFWQGGHSDGGDRSREEAAVSRGKAAGGCTNGDACPFLHAAGTGKLSLVDIRNVAALLQAPSSVHAGNASSALAPLAGNAAHPEKSADSSNLLLPKGLDDEDDDISWALSTLLDSFEGDDNGSENASEDMQGEGAFWVTELDQAQPQLDNLSSFPALPGQHTDLSHRSKAAGTSGPSVAFKLALSTLSDAFPSLSMSEVKRILAEQGGKAHAAAAYIRQTTGLTARPGATLLAKLPSYTSIGRGTTAGSPGGAQDLFIARAIATSLPTVTTGGSVSSVYSEARAEAVALAKARNNALDKATRAYLAGDGAAARQWSRQGRELDERMVAAQSRAAEDIFSARNNQQGLPSRISVDVPAASIVGMPVQLVDLHGLHPKEAATMARAVATSAACQWICFLTGARHHSSKLGKGGGSVHAAVVGTLEEEGWRVWDRLPTPGIAVVNVR